MVFFNPQGRNWGPKNYDGYGITYIVFALVYTILFYAACAFLWSYRNHPVVKMRKISLTLSSIMILHVYLFIVLIVYPLNGVFPCGVEFWVMSLYLPIGIGLFQAQNQQLLIVSREQNQLVQSQDMYKPLYLGHGKGLGAPRYWQFRFKVWWSGVSKQSRYEGLVFIGIVVQFFGALIIYCISRRFNSYGVVSNHASPGVCRRGWEWAPSIIWQFLWNYFFGPYLIWKVRNIRDIYHWRLQTILAIGAGIPGTPLWLAATYTDSFSAVNKYWVPPMWFVPGLITMEVVTLVFPIMQIFKHKKATMETNQALADFDLKKLNRDKKATDSLASHSIGFRRGRMYSMESLEECLNGNYDGLQVYSSCMELNGENIIFLSKVRNFQQTWSSKFSNRNNDHTKTRMLMFRAALSIYVNLIHSGTASYPINIESPIYAKLESIFGPATALVASKRKASLPSTPISAVSPWEEPAELTRADSDNDGYPLQAVQVATPLSRPSSKSNSSEHIISIRDIEDSQDSLYTSEVPKEFDEHVFDAANKSIKYMVWTETWQRYMQWRRSSGSVA